MNDASRASSTATGLPVAPVPHADPRGVKAPGAAVVEAHEMRMSVARSAPGTAGAFPPGNTARGLKGMLTAARVLGLVLMAVVPGGLLVLSAFVLARAVARKMRLEEGTRGERFARAMAQVRWRDVVRAGRDVL